MKYFLTILIALLPFFSYAQELLYDEGWALSASCGAYIRTDQLCPMHNNVFQSIHGSYQIQVSKQITSTFALAIDYQYHYKRHILAPLLRTDMINFYRPNSYRRQPYLFTLDIGIGWGHFNAIDDSPVDHNYLVYVGRLQYSYSIVENISLCVSTGINARTYAHHIGIAADRTDIYLHFGVVYHFSTNRIPSNISYIGKQRM